MRDMLLEGCEVPLQAMIIEIFYRLLRSDRELVRKTFPAKTIRAAFDQLDPHNFAASIRSMITRINATNARLHSLWCDSFSINGVVCEAAWIDFGPKCLTFWCLPSGMDERNKELIYVPFSSVTKYQSGASSISITLDRSSVDFLDATRFVTPKATQHSPSTHVIELPVAPRRMFAKATMTLVSAYSRVIVQCVEVTELEQVLFSKLSGVSPIPHAANNEGKPSTSTTSTSVCRPHTLCDD